MAPSTTEGKDEAAADMADPGPGTSKPFKGTCCLFPGCNQRASYGTEHRRPVYCSSHKLVGMRDVMRKLCEYQDTGPCPKNPVFGFPGEKPRFCKQHRLEGMVDVHSKKCIHPDCMKYPSYGFDKGKPFYCKEHAVPGTVHVKRTCQFPGCTKYASFGTEAGRPLFCKAHKDTSMKATPRRTCQYPGCEKRPRHMPNQEGKLSFCGEHYKLTLSMHKPPTLKPPARRSKASRQPTYTENNPAQDQHQQQLHPTDNHPGTPKVDVLTRQQHLQGSTDAAVDVAQASKMQYGLGQDQQQAHEEVNEYRMGQQVEVTTLKSLMLQQAVQQQVATTSSMTGLTHTREVQQQAAATRSMAGLAHTSGVQQPAAANMSLIALTHTNEMQQHVPTNTSMGLAARDTVLKQPAARTNIAVLPEMAAACSQAMHVSTWHELNVNESQGNPPAGRDPCRPAPIAGRVPDTSVCLAGHEHQLCSETECEQLAWYGDSVNLPKHCRQHRKQDNWKVCWGWVCESAGCANSATYGLPPDKAPAFCEQHKENDMVNFLEPHETCIMMDCPYPAHWGLGDGIALFCDTHKCPNMQRVVRAGCQHPGCDAAAVPANTPRLMIPTSALGVPPQYCKSHMPAVQAGVNEPPELELLTGDIHSSVLVGGGQQGPAEKPSGEGTACALRHADDSCSVLQAPIDGSQKGEGSTSPGAGQKSCLHGVENGEAAGKLQGAVRRSARIRNTGTLCGKAMNEQRQHFDSRARETGEPQKSPAGRKKTYGGRGAGSREQSRNRRPSQETAIQEDDMDVNCQAWLDDSREVAAQLALVMLSKQHLLPATMSNGDSGNHAGGMLAFSPLGTADSPSWNFAGDVDAHRSVEADSSPHAQSDRDHLLQTRDVCQQDNEQSAAMDGAAGQMHSEGTANGEGNNYTGKQAAGASRVGAEMQTAAAAAAGRKRGQRTTVDGAPDAVAKKGRTTLTLSPHHTAPGAENADSSRSTEANPKDQGTMTESMFLQEDVARAQQQMHDWLSDAPHSQITATQQQHFIHVHSLCEQPHMHCNLVRSSGDNAEADRDQQLIHVHSVCDQPHMHCNLVPSSSNHGEGDRDQQFIHVHSVCDQPHMHCQLMPSSNTKQGAETGDQQLMHVHSVCDQPHVHCNLLPQSSLPGPVRSCTRGTHGPGARAVSTCDPNSRLHQVVQRTQPTHSTDNSSQEHEQQPLHSVQAGTCMAQGEQQREQLTQQQHEDQPVQQQEVQRIIISDNQCDGEQSRTCGMQQGGTSGVQQASQGVIDHNVAPQQQPHKVLPPLLHVHSVCDQRHMHCSLLPSATAPGEPAQQQPFIHVHSVCDQPHVHCSLLPTSQPAGFQPLPGSSSQDIAMLHAQQHALPNTHCMSNITSSAATPCSKSAHAHDNLATLAAPTAGTSTHTHCSLTAVTAPSCSTSTHTHCTRLAPPISSIPSSTACAGGKPAVPHVARSCSPGLAQQDSYDPIAELLNLPCGTGFMHNCSSHLTPEHFQCPLTSLLDLPPGPCLHTHSDGGHTRTAPAAVDTHSGQTADRSGQAAGQTLPCDNLPEQLKINTAAQCVSQCNSLSSLYSTFQRAPTLPLGGPCRLPQLPPIITPFTSCAAALMPAILGGASLPPPCSSAPLSAISRPGGMMAAPAFDAVRRTNWWQSTCMLNNTPAVISTEPPGMHASWGTAAAVHAANQAQNRVPCQQLHAAPATGGLDASLHRHCTGVVGSTGPSIPLPLLVAGGSSACRFPTTACTTAVHLPAVHPNHTSHTTVSTVCNQTTHMASCSTTTSLIKNPTAQQLDSCSVQIHTDDSPLLPATVVTSRAADGVPHHPQDDGRARSSTLQRCVGTTPSHQAPPGAEIVTACKGSEHQAPPGAEIVTACKGREHQGGQDGLVLNSESRGESHDGTQGFHQVVQGGMPVAMDVEEEVGDVAVDGQSSDSVVFYVPLRVPKSSKLGQLLVQNRRNVVSDGQAGATGQVLRMNEMVTQSLVLQVMAMHDAGVAMSVENTAVQPQKCVLD